MKWPPVASKKLREFLHCLPLWTKIKNLIQKPLQISGLTDLRSDRYLSGKGLDMVLVQKVGPLKNRPGTVNWSNEVTTCGMQEVSGISEIQNYFEDHWKLCEKILQSSLQLKQHGKCCPVFLEILEGLGCLEHHESPKIVWKCYKIIEGRWGHQGLNVSTTPLPQWGFWQCVPFSWTTLRRKHWRHPIADMFGGCLLYWSSLN